MADEVDKLLSLKKEKEGEKTPLISFNAAKQASEVMESISSDIDFAMENQMFSLEMDSDRQAKKRLELKQQIQKAESEYEFLQNKLMELVEKTDTQKASVYSKLQKEINGMTSAFKSEVKTIDKMSLDKENNTVKIKHPESGKLMPVLFSRYLESMTTIEEKYAVQMESIQSIMDQALLDKSNDLNYHAMRTLKELKQLENVMESKSLAPNKYESKMLQLLNNAS